ncbi:3-hydroxyisobutyrate dehydrogenase [Georgenia soli]|uniref:3-hydroxyisobutyrate dehydrogenase n=1 Tax=Georgenia soli TaxID=638953 RepID=A0A2A9F2X2_9MICO|nr:3-hydroxyisobutyrate dehydrogenase [Georgenia soli]
MTTAPRVGIVGVGRMGWHIAARIAAAGFHVTAFDPRPEVMQEIGSIGLKPAASSRAVAEASDVTILMVLDGQQALDATFGTDGFADGAHSDSILLCMASLRPSDVRALDERADGRFIVLDAPVSGGVEGAKAGSLTVMASGDPEALDAVAPVLKHMSSAIYRLGERPGLGAVMKSINQSMFLASLVSSAEMLIAGVKAGLDPDQVIEVVSRSSGDSWALRNRLPLAWRTNYVSGGALGLMLKDLASGIDLADEAGVDAVSTRAAATVVREAYERHAGRGDDPLIVETLEARSGVMLRERASVL